MIFFINFGCFYFCTARQEQRERDKELAEANAVAAANQPSSYSNPPLAPSVVFYGKWNLMA